MASESENRSARAATAAAAALLLWGCPQKEIDASVSFASDGRPVFDSTRGECLTRYEVRTIDPSGSETPIWSAEAPMPVSSTGPCALSFPITYGEAQGARATYPDAAPALQRGVRYRFAAEGSAKHGAEFELP